MAKKINLNRSVYELTKEYPELIKIPFQKTGTSKRLPQIRQIKTTEPIKAQWSFTFCQLPHQLIESVTLDLVYILDKEDFAAF